MCKECAKSDHRWVRLSLSLWGENGLALSRCGLARSANVLA